MIDFFEYEMLQYMKIVKIIFFLSALLLLGIAQRRNDCMNGGVKIMIRTKQKPASLGYACLCPFNFYGENCGNERYLYCMFSKQKIINYRPRQSKQAELQFEFECFLKKLNIDATKQSIEEGNYYQLPITQEQVKNELKNKNYYIDPAFDIVWANKSSIFDSQGQIIKGPFETRTDEEILDSYPHHQFQYSYFFGVPMFQSVVQYNIYTVRFAGDSKNKGVVNVQFRNETFRNSSKLIGKFLVDVEKQQSEFNVNTLQLFTTSYYGPSRITHRLGMNTGKWRLYDPGYQKGKIIDIKGKKMPSSLLLIIVFLLIFTTLAGGKAAIKQYKKWKNKKIQSQLNQEQDKQN